MIPCPPVRFRFSAPWFIIQMKNKSIMKIQWLYLVIEIILQFANKPIHIIVILILIIILAIVVMGGLAVPKIIKSNNDCKARKYESDNHLKCELSKSERYPKKKKHKHRKRNSPP